jgi:HSP20 family protein
MWNPIAKRGKTDLARKTGDFSPFGELPFSLSRMRDEFDRMIERFNREFSTGLSGLAEGWNWGLDVDDQDDAVVVRAEAPGFDAADFDIRVEDGRLVLKASKKVETKDDKGKVQEVREQECHESVVLPAGVDKEKVDAKYSKGVLTVTLPKLATAKAKKIAVKAV